MTLAMDLNGNPVPIKQETLSGGKIELAGTSADVWTRLMPHGGDGALISGNPRQLRLRLVGRDDVPDISGWNVQILNDGYEQQHRIREYNTANFRATLEEPVANFEGLFELTSQGAGTLQYVVYPLMDFPLCVYYDSGSATRELIIGIIADDAYALSDDNVREIIRFPRTKTLEIPTRQVHKVCYRPDATVGNVTDFLSWGEYCLKNA